jgi:hypothetical protein
MKTPAASADPNFRRRTLSIAKGFPCHFTYPNRQLHSFRSPILHSAIYTLHSQKRFFTVFTFVSTCIHDFHATKISARIHTPSMQLRFPPTRIDPLISTPNPLQIRVVHLNPPKKKVRARNSLDISAWSFVIRDKLNMFGWVAAGRAVFLCVHSWFLVSHRSAIDRDRS